MLFFIINVYAQTSEELGKHMPTQNLDIKHKKNKQEKYRPERDEYDFIFKKSTNGILYGNPCAIEATRKMGFEYIVQSPGLPGSLLKEDVFFNNVWVNIKLVFRRSPFWKMILNKKFKECKHKTGDIVG